MNKYQEYIKEIERLFLACGKNNYLCNIADEIAHNYIKENVRFHKEILTYLPKFRKTLNGTLFELRAFNYYPHRDEVNSYRLLILHRMYEDANYDWWSE